MAIDVQSAANNGREILEVPQIMSDLDELKLEHYAVIMEIFAVQDAQGKLKERSDVLSQKSQELLRKINGTGPIQR